MGHSRAFHPEKSEEAQAILARVHKRVGFQLWKSMKSIMWTQFLLTIGSD